MSTDYVFEIVAKREGKYPPSFYAFVFSAYSRVRYTFRTGNRADALAMLAEFDRVHHGDKFYFTYRAMLDVYVDSQDTVKIALAA